MSKPEDGKSNGWDADLLRVMTVGGSHFMVRWRPAAGAATVSLRGHYSARQLRLFADALDRLPLPEEKKP